MVGTIHLTPQMAPLALPAVIGLVAVAMLMFDARGRAGRRMF